MSCITHIVVASKFRVIPPPCRPSPPPIGGGSIPPPYRKSEMETLDNKLFVILKFIQTITRCFKIQMAVSIIR